MKLQKKIQKVWETEAEEFGYNEVCEEAGINYRTFKRAIKLGECKPYIYEAINDALVRLRKRRGARDRKLITQDQEA